MHQNHIPRMALFFEATCAARRAIALAEAGSCGKRLGGESDWRTARRPPEGKSYAAAALGGAIFFFDFGFLSSNSKPTFPFSNFR